MFENVLASLLLSLSATTANDPRHSRRCVRYRQVIKTHFFPPHTASRSYLQNKRQLDSVKKQTKKKHVVVPRSRAIQMLFTCSLRCTDQVTSTHSSSKLSLCNCDSCPNCALHSDISLPSCTHTTSAPKKKKPRLHFTSVCSVEAHPLTERKEVAFPTKHFSWATKKKWHLEKAAAASGGFSV